MSGKQIPYIPAFPLSLKAIPYRQLHHRNIFDIYILTIRLHLCKFLNTPSESQDLSVLLLSPLRTHCVTKSGCPVLVRQFCTRAGCFSACRISFRCCPAKYGIPRIIIQSDEPRSPNAETEPTEQTGKPQPGNRPAPQGAERQELPGYRKSLYHTFISYKKL